MLGGVISRERRGWFSELAAITAAHALGSATALRPAAVESYVDFDNNAGCWTLSVFIIVDLLKMLRLAPCAG